MTLYVKLKTTRIRSGYANAKISRYFREDIKRWRYSLSFYKDFKAFNHHRELRQYVLDTYNVDIGDREQCWGL